MSDYFSDRELGPKARTLEQFTPPAWGGIASLVGSLANSGAFGLSFPDRCIDGQAICGNNELALKAAMEAELHGLSWPLEISRLDPDDAFGGHLPYTPPTLQALDLVEFVYRHVAQPIIGWHHDFLRHHHLTFDRAAGQESFRENINRILARNALAFEMDEQGKIRRIVPAVISEALQRTYFQTGDRILDVMLEESRVKFSNPDPLIRREGLERLVDSWERMKSLHDPGNKSKSTAMMLDRAAAELAVRQILETDAKELYNIGNSLLLRHHELRQTPVIDPRHIDYLFHRLFALVELVVRKNTTP